MSPLDRLLGLPDTKPDWDLLLVLSDLYEDDDDLLKAEGLRWLVAQQRWPRLYHLEGITSRWWISDYIPAAFQLGEGIRRAALPRTPEFKDYHQIIDFDSGGLPAAIEWFLTDYYPSLVLPTSSPQKGTGGI